MNALFDEKHKIFSAKILKIQEVLDEGGWTVVSSGEITTTSKGFSSCVHEYYKSVDDDNFILCFMLHVDDEGCMETADLLVNDNECRTFKVSHVSVKRILRNVADSLRKANKR